MSYFHKGICCQTVIGCRLIVDIIYLQWGFSLTKSFPAHGGWHVSPRRHPASDGWAKMSGFVSLHGRSLLLAAREPREEAADRGSEGNHLWAAGGTQEPPASHQSPGAAGDWGQMWIISIILTAFCSLLSSDGSWQYDLRISHDMYHFKNALIFCLNYFFNNPPTQTSLSCLNHTPTWCLVIKLASIRACPWPESLTGLASYSSTCCLVCLRWWA